MGYLYTVMWFMMALLLYSKFKNEGKIVYILSGYFLFAGVSLIALIFSFFGKKKHSESENK